MAVTRWRDKWHVDLLIDDRRIRRMSPVQTRKGAEQFERFLMRDLSISTPCEARKEAVPTLRSFAIEWLETYAVSNNKYSTVVSKESILRLHLLPELGDLLLSEIGPREIERYKARKLTSLSPKSVNNHLTVLRKCLDTAQEWGLVETIPKVKWLRTPPSEFDFLTFEEADRLLAHVDPSWSAMVLTALRTGLRQGELAALRWQDLDLPGRKLRVKRSVWKGHISSPKSGRFREVPLSTKLAEVLQDHRHLRGELVFCRENGSMFKYTQLRWPLWRASRRAGLRKAGWHMLRHTFASHLAMRGVPLKAIQELLGHATMEMTMRYAHLAPSIHRDAVEELDRPAVGREGSSRTPAWVG